MKVKYKKFLIPTLLSTPSIDTSIETLTLYPPLLHFHGERTSCGSLTGDVQKLIVCSFPVVQAARIRHGVKLSDKLTTANTFVSKVKVAFANAFAPQFAPVVA